MGIATFPSVSSPIKSIQRGEAVAAGNISITAVDTTKTVVNSFSTGSAGTVAATGTVNAANGSTSGISTSAPSGSVTRSRFTYQGLSTNGGPVPNFAAFPVYDIDWTTNQGGSFTFGYQGGRYGQVYATVLNNSENTVSNVSLNAMNTNGMNVALNAQSISGGSTSLTAAVYGAYLVNSTTIYATGPCRYEVVEHY
jgi:hypothetical protein